MTQHTDKDYSILDQPEILMFLFHPRPEWQSFIRMGTYQNIQIPVEGDDEIGARVHFANKSKPTILFFHGNGEIVADYDTLGLTYVNMGLNFIAVDYRGYGRSTGMPSVSAMMEDCHVIFEFIQNWLKENDFTGPFIVMGRSLGSASALELATHYKDRIDGLIIESGFAYTVPLLKLLCINIDAYGITEKNGFENITKIKPFDKPTLIIHAEYDEIIPFSDAQVLYEASPASDKKLLMIPAANHNTIHVIGYHLYMSGIEDFLKTNL